MSRFVTFQKSCYTGIYDTLFGNSWYIFQDGTYFQEDLEKVKKTLNDCNLLGNDNWVIPNINKLIQLGDYREKYFVPKDIFGTILLNCRVASSTSGGYDGKTVKAINLMNGDIMNAGEKERFALVLMCPNYNPL